MKILVMKENTEIVKPKVSVEVARPNISEVSAKGFLNFWSSEHMVINNMRYSKKEGAYVVYELSDAEYIGEFIGEVHQDRLPICNLTANFSIEGKKIYRVNDETYVIVYDKSFGGHMITLYKEMKLNGPVLTSLTGFIRIEDDIYVVPKYDGYEKNKVSYYLDKAEYIGVISEKVEKVPTENLTSYLFSKGTELYRLDESTIMVCYEEGNMKSYNFGMVLK